MSAPNKIKRRTKYSEAEHRLDVLHELRAMSEIGLTEHEMARVLGMSVNGLWLLRRGDPEIAAAMKLGKDAADARVERALYHKAIGYTYDSEDIRVVEGEVVRLKTTTHVPPDNSAMIFWLKNRQREAWRDRQDVEVSGELGPKTDIDPRELAMKVLLAIRKGLNVPITVIEHKDEA